MRIGFSLLDLAMGGAQVFFVQLARGLAARGHDVCYRLSASPGDPERVQPFLKTALDEVAHPVRRPWGLWSSDVIHLDGYHSLRRKVVFLPRWNRCVETYHSAYSVKRAGPLYPPYRVAVSAAVLQMLPPPARVVYQGIPDFASHTGPDKRFDVGVLGRFHPVKNHKLFLAVCEEMHRRRGRCSALLVGDHPQPGPYQQELDAEIERLRAKGLDLHTAGNVPPEDLSRWLSQVRVLLVTSSDEGFGRMALESLSCGVPVVAASVSGIREIVKDGESGFLVPVNDVKAFADKTVLLLDDAALSHKLGEEGKKRIQNDFSFEGMVDTYEIIYREIAAQS
jgi:glycosyltransferase involved in cell wall biosynthesis